MLSRAVYVRGVPRRPSKSSPGSDETIREVGWIADESTIFLSAGPAIPWPNKNGPWQLQAYIDTRSGVPRCVGFDIRSFTKKHEIETDDQGAPFVMTKFSAGPSGDVDELTASKLREVPFGRVVSASVWGLSRIADIVSALRPDLEEGLKEHQKVYLQHARRYDLGHFKRVAKIYTKASKAGLPPTQAVADELGISRSAAAKQVSRCRNELGLLPKSSQGRAEVAGPEKKRATTKKGRKR